MRTNLQQAVKDTTALSLVATSTGLFVLRACRMENALGRAGRNALTGAAVVAPLAGAFGFTVAKTSENKADREDALNATATLGAFFGLVAGAACGVASLAWDAFRS